ncbi:MAG: hypothetical protein ABSE73_16365 [Planctomycetota bacterium]
MKTEKQRDIGELLADKELVGRAMRAAVREAILQHKRAGNPIAEWRDGKVVWIPARKIRIRPENGKRRRR